MPRIVTLTDLTIDQLTFYPDPEDQAKYMVRVDYTLISDTGERLQGKSAVRYSSETGSTPVLPTQWETDWDAMLTALRNRLKTSEGI